MRYSKKTKAWIKNNFLIKTRKECADYLNISLMAVSRIANRYGIKKASIFTDINIDLHLPEFIYFLGFAWADAHVRREGRKYTFSLEIQKEDADTILPVINKLGYFTIKNRIRSNRKVITSFKTGNEKLGLFLAESGFQEKSNIEPTKILEKIPENLRYYWWRGFFDGDGCICISGRYRSLSFSGRFDYEWTEIKKILELLKIKYKRRIRIHKNGSTSLIECFKKKDIFTFFKYIYPSGYDGVGLQRKYSKFIISQNQQLS